MHTTNRGQRDDSSNTQSLPNVVASAHCPFHFHIMMVAFHTFANPQDSQGSPFGHHPWGRIHQAASHYVVLRRTQLHYHSIVVLCADQMQFHLPLVAPPWSCNPSAPTDDHDKISTDDDSFTVVSNRPSNQDDNGHLESKLEIVN
jgi:hypothetical protein